MITTKQHDFLNRLLAPILVITLAVSVHTSGAQQVSTNTAFTTIKVIGRHGEYVALRELLQSAATALHERFPETRTNGNLQPAAYIDFSKDEPFVEFAFFGKPGEQWYRITCGLNGSVRKSESLQHEQSERKYTQPPEPARSSDQRRRKP